jgi:hypothetical protein
MFWLLMEKVASKYGGCMQCLKYVVMELGQGMISHHNKNVTKG